MSVACVCWAGGGPEGKCVDSVCHPAGASRCVPFPPHILSSKGVAMCPKTNTEMKHRVNRLSCTPSSDALICLLLATGLWVLSQIR